MNRIDRMSRLRIRVNSTFTRLTEPWHTESPLFVDLGDGLRDRRYKVAVSK